jgi:membrane associated rhomboid family serine protease
MLNNLSLQLQWLTYQLNFTMYAAGLFILILFIVHIINMLLGYRLNVLGIYPRHLFGLIGIPCSPFLHGSFNHLFFNAIALFVLANFVLLQGITNFFHITLLIGGLSGLALWLFGRPAIHIGASGLITGYWGYLLVNAYQHPSIITVILAIVCVYYFGGIFFSIFPGKQGMSWEGHLFGLLAGLGTAYLVA